MDFFFGNDDSRKWENESAKEWSSPSRTTVRDSSIGSTLSRTSMGTSVDCGHRVLDDLKLTLEMKEHQIHELEEKVVSLERQIAFSEGKMSSKFEEQVAALETLRKCNMALMEMRDAHVEQIAVLSSQLQNAHIDFIIESDPVTEEVMRSNIVLSETAELMSLRELFAQNLMNINAQMNRVKVEAISHNLQVAEARLLSLTLREEVRASERARKQNWCCIM